MGVCTTYKIDVVTVIKCDSPHNRSGLGVHPCRSVILMWIVIFLEGDFFLENPHNSLIAMHPRYVWMVERLLQLRIPAAKLI